MYNLFYDIGYKAYDSNFISYKRYEDAEPLVVSFKNAQEAAEFIDKLDKIINNGLTNGRAFVNVVNWVKEEL